MKPYAGIICVSCGPLDIDAIEYDHQMDRPDQGWYCPKCGESADFDDKRFEDLKKSTTFPEEKAMSISTKRTLASILSFVIICFLAWVGGVEFNERSMNLAFTLWMALIFSGIASGYPFGK